jgi:PAS domain S-box-containing protein
LSVQVLISLLASRVAAARRKVEEVLRSANENLEARVRQRTADLEQARESLHTTLTSIGDAVIATDRAGRIALLNGVAEALTGWSATEAVGRPLEEVFVIVNEETRASVENPVSKVLASGTTIGLANHTILISRDGREIPIDDSGAPIRTSDGAVNGVVLVFRDVSERRRAEQQRRRLQEDNERVARVMNQIGDGFLTVDVQYRVTYANAKAAAMFRCVDGEMTGASLWDVAGIPPDSPVVRDLARAMADGVPVQSEIPYSEPDAWLEFGAHPHSGGLALLIRDVTGQKRLEEQLRQAQKMEAVGRLAGGLAHDFNNLLTVILGYAATVSNRLSADDPLRKTVGEILRAGQRAASLISQLLAFSRKQVAQPQIIELNGFIRESRDMLERLMGEDIVLVLDLHPEPCRLKMDPAQLTQILMNLVGNARDAMPTGGRLKIETRNVVRERSEVAGLGVVRPPGRYTVFAVTDTGEGIDSSTQAHIFEPFFTTKESGKGTGLGLATVYGIVTQYGGWMEVHSELGQGATFQVFCPATDDVASDLLQERTVVGPTHRATILLVEDQAAIRMLAADVLTEAGHRVLSAANGKAALELVSKRDGNLDLLITDVVMPEMSGPELASHLTKSKPGLTVLYTSGYTDHILLQHGGVERGTAFLQKPFLPESLVAKANELLSEKAKGQGAA